MVDAISVDDHREDKRYLVSWKLLLTLQTNGVEHTFPGHISDIASSGATALVDNNLPPKAQLSAAFLIPAPTSKEHPLTIQAKCKLVYCLLGSNGLFRAGIKFEAFMGNGLELLEKELSKHIAVK